MYSGEQVDIILGTQKCLAYSDFFLVFRELLQREWARLGLDSSLGLLFVVCCGLVSQAGFPPENNCQGRK